MSRADVERACRQHRPAMFQVCLSVLRNRHDAEDATSQAVINALAKPPNQVDTGLLPWLTTVARNAAVDILRNRMRVIRELPAAPAATDQSRDVQVAVDTRRLFDQVLPFLNETERGDFGLYAEVALRLTTEQELAERLGITRREVKDRRRKVRETVHAAAIAVCLIAEPDGCAVPRALAGDGAGNPTLLKAIRKHVRECPRCRGLQEDRRSLAATILTLPAVALTVDLLRKIAKAAPSKTFATASATTAAGLLVGVLVTQAPVEREPGWAEPLPPVPRPMVTGPSSAAGSRNPPPGPPSGPVKPSTGPRADAPARGPSTAPPPAVSTPSTPAVPRPATGSQALARPPSISRYWLEHDRIAATRHGACGREQTISAAEITATAPGGIASVTVLLQHRGRVIDLPLTRTAGGSTWRGEIGPLPAGYTGSVVDVVVRVVATNGADLTRSIGRLCVTRCGPHRTGSRP